MPEAISLKAMPPKEAIAFFQSKGYKIGFDWRDVEKEEHAYAFTVAKAMRHDILQDIRGAVDKALAEGTTFTEFKKGLKPALQEKGWWGKKTLTDPKTGEEKTVRLGSSRRLRIIFDTNIRSAYSAGTWERIQRVKKARPYLRYIAVLDERVREKHRQFHDIILPVDHPFWEKFYPPNGWRCRCSVQQLSERDLKRRGLEATPYDPRTQNRTVLNKRTGELQQVPRGIDPGFDFNIGKARMKVLTPRPLNKPLNIPYAGSSAEIEMPVPRNLPGKIILPDDLKEQDYVDRLLSEFGKKEKAPFIFTDVAGEQIIISDALFRDARGNLKITKRMRHRHLLLLAKTIKDPDEIWWTWEEYPKGRKTLLRRYMARWHVEGEHSPGFALFDVTPEGWHGVTTLKPDSQNYLDKQRMGSLVYRRTKKQD